MAIVSGYTGWAVDVNRIILDSSTITLGDSATKSDELENGLKRTRLRSAFCPEKYSVAMEFNWLLKDKNGKTELQRFYEWYKYKHKYGSIPFEFPKILYSPQSGIKSQDDAYNNTKTEFYKITSAVEGARRGDDVQIKMTWESVYGGTMNIEDPEESINHIEGHSDYVDVIFDTLGGTEPVSSDFSIDIESEGQEIEVAIDGYYFDGYKKARLYFEAQSYSRISVTYNNNTYSDNGGW